MTAPRLGGLLRAGRHNPQALYVQLGAGPADTDASIGWAKDPRVLKQAVDAVNTGVPVPGAWWWCSGCSVFTGPGATLTADWALALADPAYARRIVAAVNGVGGNG